MVKAGNKSTNFQNVKWSQRSKFHDQIKALKLYFLIKDVVSIKNDHQDRILKAIIIQENDGEDDAITAKTKPWQPDEIVRGKIRRQGPRQGKKRQYVVTNENCVAHSKQ